MANFGPIKGYIYFICDRLITKYGLKGPFLDVGCGTGQDALWLWRKGLHGKAVDTSESAIKVAQENLSATDIEARVGSAPAGERYNLVVCWDVLEHVEDDRALLSDLAESLNEGGTLLLTTVTNPWQWRWDDEFYGHWHRYDVKGLKRMVGEAGLVVRETVDFTFPVFWLMRLLYTFLKRPPRISGSKQQLTQESSMRSAWKIPVLDMVLGWQLPWKLVYFLMYPLRHITRGFEVMIVAQKPNPQEAAGYVWD